MSTPTLFDPLELGRLHVRNRVFLSPLTRSRATPEGVPTDIVPIYYRQRASAGLIISEATAVSRQGVGWVNAPGIYSDAQVEAWKAVTQAVHAEGGAIFLQLWHMGRVSHPDFLGGELPVGPSAIAVHGHSTTPLGKKPYVVPRALEAAELPGIAADYATAARRAVDEAGFDGVELHGANGYLIDQFIRDLSNQRTDAYGGSIANRWRFPLEVVDAVIAAVGADRTGIRVSPLGRFNDIADSDPIATYSYGARELSARGLAYIHVIEGQPGHFFYVEGEPVHPHIRKAFGGKLILNAGFTRESGTAAIAEGQADAIAFGTAFLANPDLPRRLREGAPLNPPDPSTFYTPGERGYIDYPALPT